MKNIKAGICADCGRYWTVTGGGLNDDDQCVNCEQKLPAEHIESIEPVYREPDPAEPVVC